MERGGGNYYYHADGLGSITEITETSGTVVASYTYDSFGKIVAQTGSLTNPYTFTGREFDSESGLYYYRMRHYEPKIGRFMQPDPSHYPRGKGENIPYLLPFSLKFARELNSYFYATNNPVNLVDPTGLQCEWEAGSCIVAISGAVIACTALLIPEPAEPIEIILCFGGIVVADIVCTDAVLCLAREIKKAEKGCPPDLEKIRRLKKKCGRIERQLSKLKLFSI